MRATSFTPEPRGAVVRRRLVTISRDIVLLLVLTALALPLAAACIVVDAIRSVWGRPWMAIRFVGFAWLFLFTEVVGIAWFFVQWVAAGFGTRREWLVEQAWTVQIWWAGALWRYVVWSFRVDVTVEGADVIEPGPVIAMFRHSSIVDNLLPAVLLTRDHGIRLRWIIKKELLSVPALDVGARRLPNYFVDRASDDPRGELRRIEALAADLGDRDGVLIFPEGTRSTAQKRARAVAKLEATQPEMAAAARRLRHLMPPRPGGVLTLLDSGADVLVVAHHGLDGFAHLADLWSGALVGGSVRVRFRRFPAAEIPTRRSERVDWLMEAWQDADEWISAQDAARSGPEERHIA